MKFGTDGVRGAANVELTADLALSLGRVAARVMGGSRWAVGRDTRRSGPMLAAAFSAGLASDGVDVVDLGVAPTPEVAWWSATEGAPAAMVSASHNPFQDNGIKLFAAGGLKLPDAVEREIEAGLTEADPGADSEAGPATGPGGRDVPAGAGVGTIRHASAHDGYGREVVASLQGRRLDGLRLAVDCANGAASVIAPRIFEELGAEVEVIHGTPDGVNINRDCGSTHPAELQQAVTAHGAHAGVAFDGDADRVLLVDADGQLVDGDHIIAIAARDMADRGALRHDTVVVTVMTNLGFRLAMAEAGIRVLDTPVGDRYVLEVLESGGYSLGGEQSGHVIFRELATTGDGLLTAVQVLDVVARTGRDLADLAQAAMTRLPQVLRNVRVAARDPAIAERIASDVAAVEEELGPRGRVLVRPSGTEPLVRVMVEAPTEAVADAAAARLVKAVEALAG